MSSRCPGTLRCPSLKHLGANFGTVGILTHCIRLFRIGFGVYTATFRMPLRECIRIHAEWTDWKSFAHLSISDTEWFPKLAKFYRQSIGAVVDGTHHRDMENKC